MPPPAGEITRKSYGSTGAAWCTRCHIGASCLRSFRRCAVARVTSPMQQERRVPCGFLAIRRNEACTMRMRMRIVSAPRLRHGREPAAARRHADSVYASLSGVAFFQLCGSNQSVVQARFASALQRTAIHTDLGEQHGEEGKGEDEVCGEEDGEEDDPQGRRQEAQVAGPLRHDRLRTWSKVYVASLERSESETRPRPLEIAGRPTTRASAGQ